MEENSNLEDFIKGRLESPEFVYSEKDWIDMENRLDEAGLVPVGIFSLQNTGTLIATTTLIILLAFLGGWFARDLNYGDEQIDEADRGIVQSESSVMEEKNLMDDQAIISAENSGKQIVEGFVAEDEKGNSSSAENEKGQIEQGDRNIVATNDKNDIENSVQIVPDHNTASGIVNESKPDRTIQTVLPLGPEWPLIAFGVPEFKTYGEYWEFEEKEPEANRGSFTFGLSLSPDFTSASQTERGKITARAGLELMYSPLKRFAISTGVYYNKKRYETSGEEYIPPSGYWIRKTNGIVPELVDGSCSVIDVPFSIYYKLTDREKFNISISSGISNYLILDEDYYWFFDGPNPGAAEGWSTDSNSKAYLGLINFSVAFEYNLKERLSIVAEPYLKLPLKEMGWGNLPLYGAGPQFTLRFRP